MGNAYLSGGSEPFLNHFDQQHQQLGQSLREVQEVLDRPPSDQDPEEGIAGLTQLRQLLQEHFEDEERGCFDEIVSRYPHLAAEAREIEQQHGPLMEILDQIIADAKSTGDPFELAPRFTEFRKALSAHEQVENQLIHRGLNMSE